MPSLYVSYFLRIKIKIWQTISVNKLYFVTLSGLSIKITSICICDDWVTLVCGSTHLNGLGRTRERNPFFLFFCRSWKCDAQVKAVFGYESFNHDSDKRRKFKFKSISKLSSCSVLLTIFKCPPSNYFSFVHKACLIGWKNLYLFSMALYWVRQWVRLKIMFCVVALEIPNRLSFPWCTPILFIISNTFRCIHIYIYILYIHTYIHTALRFLNASHDKLRTLQAMGSILFK